MIDILWSQPHHDGSEMYVPDPSPRLGGNVTVLLRVPRSSDVTDAWVRALADGEPELVHASVALRRGGLRWLYIGDDALAFLREYPGETVLVHAARANHTPVQIPAAVAGPELLGLAGSADLEADVTGLITLPDDGPAFKMWRLADHR
jgi:alpha-glucosidase